MNFRSVLFLFGVIVLLISCKTDNRYNYAIKDFREVLQPHLVRIVEKGYVRSRDSALQQLATDEELMQLGRSEHPILRATAFREMFKRSSIKHFDIIMGHLSDTAMVAVDAGEFGLWDRMVSDDILDKASWNTQQEKDKTVEQVMLRHNYLKSAYTILLGLEPQEKYYAVIRDMATRPRRLSEYENYELGYRDIEYALYGLAKFRKNADVPVIRGKMMDNMYQLSSTSFRLLTEFPDSLYIDLLQEYHRWHFYKFSGVRPGGFSGERADRSSPEEFIEALVAQKSDRSAKILDTMLNRIPTLKHFPDHETIYDNVVRTIWENPCPAYEKLRKKIEARALELEKWYISINLDSTSMQRTDTVKPKIRW